MKSRIILETTPEAEKDVDLSFQFDSIEEVVFIYYGEKLLTMCGRDEFLGFVNDISSFIGTLKKAKLL